MSATMITNFFSTTGKRKPDHVDGNNNEDTSETQRQKTAEPVVSKEQAITATLKTLLKWEKEIRTPIGFITEGESRTVVEFWCEICHTFCDIILYKVPFKS
jgi:hypothetical protein